MENMDGDETLVAAIRIYGHTNALFYNESKYQKEQNPFSKKIMDTSNISNPKQENTTEPSQGIANEILGDEELDTENYDLSSENNLLSPNKSANFHPLMFPPLSSDFPDLIPKAKYALYDKTFTPEAHSSMLETELETELENNLNIEIAANEYSEELPDFPDSPSALKKSMLIDLPVEITGDITSDNENENDKSIYEAHLSSNFLNVSLTMNEKEGNLNFLAHNKRSNKLRKIKVMHTQTSQDSDVSSLDSNSDSLKSEDVFNAEIEATDDTLKNDDDLTIPEPIVPLSAAEERRHARHWQRMILPGSGGEQRTIDMRVIEPYKRLLSHGGYLRSNSRTAVILFSACYLPDRSRVDYEYVMDNLFLYVLWTLERLVTDEYALVYLHGGASRLPSFSWLKRCYQMVGRKLRKNLSHLYVVHPTLWIKTMFYMAKPFISSKFYRKISFMGSLRELLVRVPLEATAIPDKVKLYDSLRAAV